MNCLNCGHELPPFQHCCIDKQGGLFRIQFKEGLATVRAFQLTEFQLRLLGAAMMAGMRCD